MARRWTERDIKQLKTMAHRLSPPNIAEKMDRSVGGVVFKAHQLKLSLRTRANSAHEVTPIDPGSAGFEWKKFRPPAASRRRED